MKAQHLEKKQIRIFVSVDKSLETEGERERGRGKREERREKRQSRCTRATARLFLDRN